MSELRPAAVLFADIAAATALRAQVGDRQADAILDPLLADLTRIVQRHGGIVLKSDGDDVVAVFERANVFVDDAVRSAIECQKAARAVGRKLYVGVDAGIIEFREVLGRPDIAGMAVNVAARLHKLVPDLPGHIFLAATTVQVLSRDLRGRTRPYGTRLIKGVGQLDVHTLDWNDDDTVMPTRFAMPLAAAASVPALVLHHLGRSVQLSASVPMLQIGRDRNNELRIEDEEQRVSSKHLKILNRSGAWIVQDISRNGTCARFDANPNEIRLLGEDLKLIGPGRLCLGRPFAEDPQERFTVRFELLRS